MVRIKGTIEEQIEIEEYNFQQGIKKYTEGVMKAAREGRLDETPYGKLLIQLGIGKYTTKLKEYLELDIRISNVKKVQNLIRLICDDPEVLAHQVLTSVIGKSVYYDNNLTRTLNYLGHALIDNFIYKKIKEDNPKLHAYLGYEFSRANSIRRRELIRKNLQSLASTYDVDNTALMIRVTTTLIELLENSGANIITVTKGFSKGHANTNILQLTPQAMELMATVDSSKLAEKVVNKLPLIVPPRDWVGLTDGGYYKIRSELTSGTSPTIQRFHKKSSFEGVIPIINKLQQTAWRVNLPMLDFVEHCYYNDLKIGGIPESRVTTWKDYMTMPEYTEDTKQEWGIANKKRQEIIIRLDAEFSKRLQLSLVLGTANRMEGYEKIYYAYQLDYRGRVYPSVTTFHMQQAKHVKSMLEFGEGQYLTPDGIRWLKIHLANTFGLDKELYDARVKWVDDNYDNIMKVANDPKGHLSMVVEADSPYEYVAACLAYKDHLEGRAVHLPIQLDATCSGIQIYSGILRDEPGALSVNVIGDTRNDIYQVVADEVVSKLNKGEYPKLIEYKTSDGKEAIVTTDSYVPSLKANVTRSMVKQPTMTTPYSVTKYGMSQQIRLYLIDMLEKGKQFWEGDVWILSKLLTTLVYNSIHDVVVGAKLGQEYLVNLGNSLDIPAVWYTPIYEFPVHQNTLLNRKKKVKTVYGEIVLHKEGTKHSRSKQRSAIAPNFIHSLDSTILLNTIDYSMGSIGVVHDCFLVPPNSGYETQELFRQAFLRVMLTDPLRLLQQQLDPLEEVEFPMYGSLSLEEILDSQYIIS